MPQMVFSPWRWSLASWCHAEKSISQMFTEPTKDEIYGKMGSPRRKFKR